LDDSDISAAFEQMGSEAVAQRMSVTLFLIPAASASSPAESFAVRGCDKSRWQDPDAAASLSGLGQVQLEQADVVAVSGDRTTSDIVSYW
jgi:hypothetical protein